MATPIEQAPLVRCAPTGSQGNAPQTGTRTAHGDGRSIDMHCHALCPAVEARLSEHPRRSADLARYSAAQGAASAAQSMAMLKQIQPKLTDLGQRLADMDAAGIDIQVLSPAPNQYYHWADDDLAEEIVEMQNSHIAALCARHPDRLMGLGVLALQNPLLAVKQLSHAVRDLGLRGVEVSTAVEGVSIADARFAPVLRAAEELGCVVLLHPFAAELGERLNQHYLWNVIGQPLETTIALSELILSGALDRHPRLRLCACHGGGYLPAYWGRLDHAFKVRPEARGCAHPPSAYLKRIHYDTVVYDPAQLRALIDVVGVSQIVAGTDYPYDMGDSDVGRLIEATPDLSPDERRAILGGNAMRLLGLVDAPRAQ